MVDLEPGDYFVVVRGRKERDVDASALYYAPDRLGVGR
jgi:hypothetical protein